MKIIREAAMVARIVALQRRVRTWLERRRELRNQQQKELELQLLNDALQAEEDELVMHCIAALILRYSHDSRSL